MVTSDRMGAIGEEGGHLLQAKRKEGWRERRKEGRLNYSEKWRYARQNKREAMAERERKRERKRERDTLLPVICIFSAPSPHLHVTRARVCPTPAASRRRLAF